jgi:hypothetical protein
MGSGAKIYSEETPRVLCTGVPTPVLFSLLNIYFDKQLAARAAKFYILTLW